LKALVRMLRRAQGTFVLAFARCDSDELREGVVQALRDALAPAGVTIHEVKLTARIRDLPSVLDAQGGDGDPLFVYDLEAAMPAIAPEWAQAQLNERRGLYQKLGRPLVFWLPEHTLRLVARGAPDFWAWRSGIYEFIPFSAAIKEKDFRFQVDTGGGAVIVGDVATAGGDFVGRDRVADVGQIGREANGSLAHRSGEVSGPSYPRERPEREMTSLRTQLEAARDNLSLIRERKSQYVMWADVPLQLVKAERELKQRIADLEAQLAEFGAF
jgi:hypothetical protein